MLRKLMRVEASNLFTLLIPVGLFLLIQLITGGVLLLGKPDTCVLISPSLLLVAGVLLALALAVSRFVTFEQAVRMGATRRMALGLVTRLVAMEVAALFALCAVLVLLEQLLGRFVWPLLSPGVEMHNFITEFSWWIYPAAAIGSMIVGSIAGAGLQRFGSKFGWSLWLLWMLCFFVIDKLPWPAENILYCVILVAAGLFIWSIWSYLHAVIKR